MNYSVFMNVKMQYSKKKSVLPNWLIDLLQSQRKFKQLLCKLGSFQNLYINEMDQKYQSRCFLKNNNKVGALLRLDNKIYHKLCSN